MRPLPPGTILQLMYFKERIKKMPVGHFIEVGAGAGDITYELLNSGWTGTVYDLEAETVNRLHERFSSEIFSSRLKIKHCDYLAQEGENDADLVISCMVMEHMNDTQESKYLRVSCRHLRKNGRIVGFVPAGMKYWGIEDEIAGHCRRYERKTLQDLFARRGWSIEHIAGLTFPVSNLLLPLSNFLVNRAESSKLVLTDLEKTKLSGCRDVTYKTSFPPFMKWMLNPITIRPLHWLQKIFRNSHRSMVLYFEVLPNTDFGSDT